MGSSHLLGLMIASISAQGLGGEVTLRQGPVAQGDSPPNILFIALDDTGIDQWSSFGWGQDVAVQRPPVTPVLDAITAAGVRFTNCWAMPECSPSRTAFFTGRLPMRTGVEAAITTAHLPASMCSMYEVMTPTLLRTKGYVSGFSGKWHSGETPYDELQPIKMGWDWYLGNWLGFVPGTDTTAGQQLIDPLDDAHPNGWLPCGTMLGDPDDPLNQGPCCLGPDECVDGVTGMDCLDMGGVPLVTLQADESGNLTPVFDAACGGGCDEILYTQTEDGSKTARNGYWVWGKQWSNALGDAGLIDYFHGSLLTSTTDGAIDWLASVAPVGETQKAPWYLALQYNTAHDPIMLNSIDLVARMEADGIDTAGLDCGSLLGIKIVFPYMIEESDTEIGRVLVERGLGSYDQDGTFVLGDLEAANTVIAWVGDNGTFYSSTRAPFNPLYSKATVFQTGVWVPMAVAGAGVATGSVDHPVNVADLFGLFADVAGVDLDVAMPAGRQLDSMTLLPYLTDPDAPSVRTFNMAQCGSGVFNPFDPPQACLIALSPELIICDDIHFAAQGLCESNGGTWMGVDPSDREYPVTCCDYALDDPGAGVTPGPARQFAISIADDDSPAFRMWKLIARQAASCVEDAVDYSCLDDLFFFHLPKDVPPLVPGLDNPGGVHQITLPEDPADLEATLSTKEYEAFMTLACELKSQWASADSCRSDVTMDGLVNTLDLLGVVENWGGDSETLSFFDIWGSQGIPDGQVNVTDLLYMIAAWSGSTPCAIDEIYPGADCLLEFAADCP